MNTNYMLPGPTPAATSISSEIRAAQEENAVASGRKQALEALHAAIVADDAFTAEEKSRVEVELDTMRERVASTERFIEENTRYLETTVLESERKIATRERVLNAVFAESPVSGHRDLMHVFGDEHDALKRIVEQAKPVEVDNRSD